VIIIPSIIPYIFVVIHHADTAGGEEQFYMM
jgi:hypothetical protein